jgi:hypothetical protein
MYSLNRNRPKISHQKYAHGFKCPLVSFVAILFAYHHDFPMAKKEVIICPSSIARFEYHLGVLPVLLILIPFLVYHWLPPTLGGLGDIEQTFFGFAFIIFSIAVLSPIASYYTTPNPFPKIIITERELVFDQGWLFKVRRIPLSSVSDAYLKVDEEYKNRKRYFALSPRQQIVLAILLGWDLVKRLFLRKQELVIKAADGKRLAELDVSKFDDKGMEQLKAMLQERIPRRV